MSSNECQQPDVHNQIFRRLERLEHTMNRSNIRNRSRSKNRRHHYRRSERSEKSCSYKRQRHRDRHCHSSNESDDERYLDRHYDTFSRNGFDERSPQHHNMRNEEIVKRTQGTQTDRDDYSNGGPISTQNAYTSTDFSPILTNLTDYACQVPSPNINPSETSSQSFAPPYEPALSFITDILDNENDTVDHSTQIISKDIEENAVISPNGNSERNVDGTKETSDSHAQIQLFNSDDDSVIAGQDIEPHNTRQLTSIIKNNNPEWHCLSKDRSCKICKLRCRSQSAVIAHSINVHPSNEVIQSRISPDAAELLRDSNAIHKCQITRHRGRSEYEQFCYFCNMSVNFEKYGWMRHISKHTGYYRLQCAGCSKKFIQKTIHGCADTHKVEDVTHPSQRRYNEQFQNAEVMAYLCNFCNYVRFDEMEIQNHLKNEHDGNVQNNFKEVIFLRFTENKQYHTTARKSNEGTGSLRQPLTKEIEIAESSNEIKNTSLSMATENTTDEESDESEESWREIVYGWETR